MYVWRTVVWIAAPPSPNPMSVPTLSAATTRYVTVTEKSGRVSRPERPTPIAAMTPSSRASTSVEIAIVPAETCPRATANTRNGSEAARNARAVSHAAIHLPTTSCAVLTSVTWVVASVPASRSPLIALPLSAGETSVASSSTKNTIVENTPPPPSSHAFVASTRSTVTIATSSTNTPSSTYQATPRTRCLRSSVTISHMPRRKPLMRRPPRRAAPPGRARMPRAAVPRD